MVDGNYFEFTLVLICVKMLKLHGKFIESVPISFDEELNFLVVEENALDFESVGYLYVDVGNKMLANIATIALGSFLLQIILDILLDCSFGVGLFF